MPRPSHRAGVKTIGLLVALSLGAGLLAAAAAIPVIGAGGVIVGHAAQAFNNMPVDNLSTLPSTSVILDRYGNPIATYVPGYPRPKYRVPVAYDQIAPVMRDAIVAIEDSRFYQHGAFDFRGTFRALLTTLSGSGTQGGSTLAQQYVKNALVLTATSDQQAREAIAVNLLRKLKELRIAANVEHAMTKDQLLAAYLNATYYPNNSWGIENAAESYFSTTAAKLTLPEAALLAGMVENPTAYDPVAYPQTATERRNTVLAKMAELKYITPAEATAAEALPLGLHVSYLATQSGCTAGQAAPDAFFCDYVLAVIKNDPAFAKVKAEMNAVGGLKIYTTLDPQMQRAANGAVNYVLPAPPSGYNPNHDVDTEVLVEPGTGFIRGLAINRVYGNGPGQSTVNYAVDTKYGGSFGVQTGSSSKIFTLVTALRQGMPFGWNTPVSDAETVQPYYNCQGQYVPPFQVVNAETGAKIPTLYNGTTQSVNVFFAHLESKVGLCNVVKTAVDLGMTRADGVSLLTKDPNLPNGNNYSADNYPSFTLGSMYVSPLDMAAAYATIAARGIYCHPIPVFKVTDNAGNELPVESANCHRALNAGVADAANYVLQGVLVNGTAGNRGLGIPAAAKTGTANDGYYAAFAGYTPKLAGYVSVFNPVSPTGWGKMLGCPGSSYRELGTDYASCPGQMFGDNAPGATWQMTFLHISLPAVSFVYPPDYPYFSMGDGHASPQPPTKCPGNGGGGTGGGGNGKCPPKGGGTPPPSPPAVPPPT